MLNRFPCLTLCLVFSLSLSPILPGTAFSASPAATQEPYPVVFPEKAGVVDVTKAPYNADPTGKTDSTGALQAALSAFPNGWKIVYLPKGTYRISKRLKWPTGGASMKRTTLQGESREGTILKLQDQCPDFGDPAKSQGMILTGMPPAQRFGNEVRNLTFDTGKGNPGAVGVQFMANNQGCMRHLLIRSGDGQGVCGIDFAYADEIGPLLVKDVTVEGFDYGVRVARSVNSETVEHLTVRGQKKAGLLIAGQVFSIRGLHSENAVTAVSVGPGAMVTLIDSELKGTEAATDLPAIEIKEGGTFYGRNIAVTGYKESVRNDSGNKKGLESGPINEFISHDPLSVFPSPPKALGLEIRETPEVPWDDPKTWAVITDFGAVASDRKAKKDVTAAIQKAIDSGATTVCIPNGWFFMGGKVIIRNNVRRIIGAKGRLTSLTQGGDAGWILEDGKAPVVVFERIDSPGIEQASSRTLVVKSGQVRVTGKPGAKGDVFLEDVVSGGYEFHGQNVWARQINPENLGVKILNDGGNLWILGLKTERGGSLIHTKNGGKTQVDGGFNYSTTKEKMDPMFVNEDSSVSLVMGETNNNKHPYQTIIKETRKGETRYLNKPDAPSRATGAMLPLYVGYQKSGTDAPQKPFSKFSATPLLPTTLPSATAPDEKPPED